MASNFSTKILDQIKVKADEGFLWSMSYLVTNSQCESPIEMAMLWAVYSHLRFSTPLPVYLGPPGFDAIHSALDPGELMLCTQAVADPYRIDILIVSTLGHYEGLHPVKLAIECDGHNFHERTKEQAARDRARDRALQSQGLTVFRFTGSEIYNDPVKCADEVVMHLLRLMNPKITDPTRSAAPSSPRERE